MTRQIPGEDPRARRARTENGGYVIYALRPECRVQTSRMGGNRFRIEIPRYLDFYRQGRLLLDEMVTRRGRLDDINEAFRAMKAGEVARSVLMFD